jgi:YD repeat-containing protein
MGTTSDKTVEYSYDAFGHQVTEKSVGIKHTSTYDKAGNRTKITYADGRTVSTTYDALHRPAVLRDDNGTASVLTDDVTTQYGYDLAGRAVQFIAPNGQVTRNTYDELGRLTARTLYRSINQMTEAGRVASFTWMHDKLGNVISQTEYWFASGNQPARERTTAMTYDDANRLITEVITEPGLAQVTTSYAYDAANNRTTKAVTLGAGTAPANTETGHWTCTYNSANQLIKLEKRASAGTAILATTTYTYDANGNRISKVESVPATSTVTNRTTTYTWDVFDRLASVTHPVLKYTARQTYTYTYDYRTRRTGIARAAVSGGLAANHTAVVFSGGLSVADYERPTNTALTGVSTTATPTVPALEYSRGPQERVCKKGSGDDS